MWRGEPRGRRSAVLPDLRCGAIFGEPFRSVAPGRVRQASGESNFRRSDGTIVNERGERIGWGRAFGRMLGYFVSGIVIYIGFVWIGLDAHKQGWHDKIAGT